MKITLNGDPAEVTAPRLDEAIAELGYSGTVATALNGAFVPLEARPKTVLREDDALEVVAPLQGG